jgi:hypothetical protein
MYIEINIVWDDFYDWFMVMIVIIIIYDWIILIYEIVEIIIYYVD